MTFYNRALLGLCLGLHQYNNYKEQQEEAGGFELDDHWANAKKKGEGKK